MDKIIYVRDKDFSGSEAERIELDFPSELNIWELKIIFRRLCTALGYIESTIENAFGDEEDDYQRSLEAQEKAKQIIKDTLDKIDNAVLPDNIDDMIQDLMEPKNEDEGDRSDTERS